jgi:hypothetical protein
MLLNFRKSMGLLTGLVSLTFLFLFFFILSLDIRLIENRVS